MGTLLGEAKPGSCNIRTANGLPIYEETWHYIVEGTSSFEERSSIIQTQGLPVPNQTTSPGGYAQCRSVNATRRETAGRIWDVTATFSSEVKETSLATFVPTATNNPAEWVPIYETKFERLQEIVTKDQSGNAIANSAGQAYETGLTITRKIPVWEFYQFESDGITDEQIIDRSETVNSVEFKGRDAKTLLLVVLESVIWQYLGQRVRLTKYQLKYNHKNWRHKRLDVGTQYLSGGNLLDFKSNEGSIMLGSLNGSGGKQTAGTAPAVREFDLYASLDFETFLRV